MLCLLVAAGRTMLRVLSAGSSFCQHQPYHADGTSGTAFLMNGIFLLIKECTSCTLSVHSFLSTFYD